MPDSTPPFHLAFPVTNLASTRQFYGDLLECEIGRASDRWIDLNFWGHQVTAHLVTEMPVVATNPVDGKAVPSSHFGCVLEWDEWQALAQRLRSVNQEFLIEPHLRFEGQPGEQATMFICDPSGNGLEFKSFKEKAALFAVS